MGVEVSDKRKPVHILAGEPAESFVSGIIHDLASNSM
jgi:hypothetical protein